MPIDTENRGFDIRLLAPDGNAIELGKVIDCDLTMSSDTPDIGNMEYCRLNDDITATVNFQFPRMNRKHFVNELCRNGYSRKEAKRIARGINGNYGKSLFYYKWDMMMSRGR